MTKNSKNRPRHHKETDEEKALREAQYEKSRTEWEAEVRKALWAGDTDTLERIAACSCCCYEHTYGRGCPAYSWGACRGQGSSEDAEQLEKYAQFYMETRGMTRDQFFNRKDGSDGT